MIKPITGQYECVHRSILKLDYFTSRLDRLTLYPDGHFVFITQERSRLANAAQSLASGQQASISAPEIRREGSFNLQGDQLTFHFSDGTQEQAQIAGAGTGLQWGPNYFEKVSDSTMLPPTNRLKKDMDDIAKGIKIAGALGGMALKAAKVVQETLQTSNEHGQMSNNQATNQGVPQQPPQQSYQQPQQYQQPAQQPQPAPQPAAQPQPQPQTYQQPATNSQPAPAVQHGETIYCDQCGVRARPGKKYCNNCGALLP